MHKPEPVSPTTLSLVKVGAEDSVVRSQGGILEVMSVTAFLLMPANVLLARDSFVQGLGLDPLHCDVVRKPGRELLELKNKTTIRDAFKK